MKDCLKLYYSINIEIDDIERISFSYNSKNYIFIRTHYINYELINYLLNYNYINKPILNNYNQYITEYNNEKYLLFFDDKSNINIVDMIYFLNQNLQIIDNDLHNKWCEKIDYHEYQITQFGYKYKLLRESINYIVGLSEIGIQLLNTIDLKMCYSCLVHNRITNELFDFKNPLNIIIDYRIRDIAEYIKYNFFYNNLEVFDQIINKFNLNKEEYKLLFARLLLITQYYDIYEKIIDEKKEEKEIEFIILKLNNYEKYLKKIYLYLKRYIDIDNIELFNN